MNWRPIAEMPEEWKDGRPVLLGNGKDPFYAVAAWQGHPLDWWADSDGGFIAGASRFTHYAADFAPIGEQPEPDDGEITASDWQHLIALAGCSPEEFAKAAIKFAESTSFSLEEIERRTRNLNPPKGA